MGQCSSVPDAAEGDDEAVMPPALRPALKKGSAAAAAAASATVSQRSVRINSFVSARSATGMARPPSMVERAASATDDQPPRTSIQIDIIGRVESLQQELALISTHPLLALPEAADMVAKYTGSDAVAIYAFPDDEVECCALVATSGEAAAPLERATVLRGDCWSAIRLAEAATARIVLSDAGAADGMPEDFAILHRGTGLRSFVAVAVGPKSSPLGVLVLGKKLPGGFDDRNSLVWVNAAATGLLQHLRPRQVAQAARMLRSIDDTGDPVSAISALLQGGARFMYRATNISMGLRLAVLEGEDSCGKSLLFESERASAVFRGDPGVSTGKSVVLPLDPRADVTVREVPLANTLLRTAVLQKKARFIKDCVSYVQNCPAPAQDVFTSTSEVVTSLVVVPLLAGNDALGALYFTQDKSCDFSNIQDTLLGFVHCVTLTLYNRLFGHMDVLKGMVDDIERHRPVSLPPSPMSLRAGSHRGPSRGPSLLDGAAPFSGAQSNAAKSESGYDTSDSQGPQDTFPGAARLSKVSSHRLATEAMLKSLQQEIRKGRRRSSMLTFQSDLVIHEAIGRGGFGCVFRGTWHSTPAAIKVMNARSTDSEAVSDAMEMAVLSSVQHPNIIQVYCCLTDMVEVKDASPDSAASCLSQASFPLLPASSPPPATARVSSGVAGRPRYRRAMPGEELDVPTYNIVVMEYCDKGTLKEAVHGGMFHRQLDNGAIGVDLMGVVNVLLDIAYSIQYIHRMNLLHSDVKLDNILLKTDFSRPSGVVPKLADFGLAKILKETEHVINHSGAGTVTHLAPEMFRAGTRITTAVDIYAFGILMWEFYTGQRPYAGLNRDAVIHRVLARNARPSFPGGVPPAYAGLAAACWSADPGSRPPVSGVIARLQQLAVDLLAQ